MEKQKLINAANAPHGLTVVSDTDLLDNELLLATGEQIEFKYDDSIRDPDFPSAGTLTATIHTGKKGILRVASWEETPESQAGGLVDKTYLYAGDTTIKYVVTGENKGEHDRVAIGFKPEDPPVTTDQSVSFPARYYEIQRTDEGNLQIQFTGIKNLDATIQLRNGQVTPTPTH